MLQSASSLAKTIRKRRSRSRSKLFRRSLVALSFGLSLAAAPSLAHSQTNSMRQTRTVLAIKKAEPAVVNIEGNKPAATQGSTRTEPSQVNGMGAGVLIDSRGYILTNQHVIQDVARIEVTLSDGTKFIGKLIARDPLTDLALVKIESNKPLPVVKCGTSSDLMRGEPVIAIGNPFGYHHTVTEGIISALHRNIPVNGDQEYPDLIQTDASINPGNSGGPLLNADGLMIGINAAVRIGAQGIGFAIPVDRAVEVAADMIAQHRRNAFESGFNVQTLYADGKSSVAVVTGDGKLQRGDVIRAVDGRSVANRLEYELALIGYTSGAKVPLKIERQGKEVDSQIVLGNASASNTRVQLASTGSVQESVYRTFGLRLELADAKSVQSVDSSYKGGLRVTSVRAKSPADKAQIQVGDILVGMLEWQTPNFEDLAWIAKSSELQTEQSPKFHIMRGKEVFWGTFDLDASAVR